MSRFVTAVLLVAAPVALLAQQASTATQTPPAKPPAAGSSASAVFPKGTYVVKMTDGSTLEVTFGDGVYNATQDGQPIATGKFTAKGNQIVMSDNSDACGMSGEGTYTWAFDGKALTFKGSHDQCDQRAQILNGYPFIKK
jgi:endonuclease YncB( thermonuclease family)